MKDPYKKKDEELFKEVLKVKNGDDSSCQRIYELSEKYIYKIINDIVKNHHTTEDLMQEAYIQIYNKLDTLQEEKAFYVWAGRIATNLTLRYIQKNSKEVLATPDEEGETDFIFDKASEDNEKFIPESVLVDREKQRLLADIIDNLSIEQKFCVQYFYYEEMSVNEIAELMGCSAGTVKSRLNYARKSIKEAVIELDVKHGTRLYSLASAPLFFIVFRAVVEGLLPAVAGAAGSAAMAGGMAAASVSSSGAAAVGGVSTVGNGAVSGSAATAGSVAAAGKTASASGVKSVKNLVLEKLKNIGGILKTDVERISRVAKNTAKEFGASTFTTKVAAVTVVGTLVAMPFVNGDGMGANEAVEFTVGFAACYTDAGIFYKQYKDQINGETYNHHGLWPGKDELSREEDIYIDIYSDKANDKVDVTSNSTALSENNLQELISYGLQFKDCKGVVNEWGVLEHKESVNHEIIIEYNGEECICSIDKVNVYLDDALNISEYYDENINYEKIYFIELEGTLSSASGKNVEGTLGKTKNATTVPGLTDVADPNELSEMTMTDIEIELPEVEKVREIEQMQTLLYIEYTRTNMTDEVFCSLMEQVPCTVTLQDGNSYSMTLAEFIFKDWSGYADLDKIDYDAEVARELSTGYVTTDSLIDN